MEQEWNALSVTREILLVCFINLKIQVTMTDYFLGPICFSATAFCSKNTDTLRCYSFIRSDDTNMEDHAGRVFWGARI